MSLLRLPARAGFWLCVLALGALFILMLAVSNLAQFCAAAGGYVPARRERKVA